MKPPWRLTVVQFIYDVDGSRHVNGWLVYWQCSFLCNIFMDRASYKSVGAPKYVWSASVQSGCMWDQTLEK